MHGTSELTDTPGVRTSEQRTLMLVGLVVVAMGLMLVIGGLVWGQYVYVAERPFQLMQQQAMESLNSEIADGIGVSGVCFAPPTYLDTALSQPPTWLGALALVTGFWMLIGSVPRTETQPHDVAQPAVQAPVGPDDAVFIVDE